MVSQKKIVKRPQIYGISGKKKHGKDWFASLINGSYHSNPLPSNFEISYFATPIKNICKKIFGLSEAQLYDQQYKEEPLVLPVVIDLYLEALQKETGLILQQQGLTATSPRELMQFVGSNYIRSSNPEYFTSYLTERIKSKRRILIPDTRFPNEAVALRSIGGLVIKIIRLDIENSEDTHDSETSIDLIIPDLLIGTLSTDNSLPLRVARLLYTNNFSRALSFDYRKIQEAIQSYRNGNTLEYASKIIGSGKQALDPLHHILDYYKIARRTTSNYRVPKNATELISGVLHKKCTKCLLLLPCSNFNVSTRSNDNLHYHCRSCQAKDHKERYLKYTTNSSNNKLKNIFKASQKTSKYRNIDFSISFEDIEMLVKQQDNLCWYSKVPLSLEIGDLNKLSIDRIDSSKGYTIDNIVLCTKNINLMKRNLSVLDFHKTVKEIYNNFSSNESKISRVVNFKKLHPAAIIPSYAGSARSSGLDLAALSEFMLESGRVLAVPTGIAMQCPEGYEAQVRPRSGLAKKYGVTVLNSPGTIDEDYRGEITVLLINHSNFPYYGKAGERIAQLVVKKIEYHTVAEVEEFVDNFENDRGERGFGSSGK